MICLDNDGSDRLLKKRLLIISGFISLGLGALGVALPVLPTTPFVLLAAICFSAGNSKYALWLKKNRVFGPYIENYRTKQGISITHKVASIAFLWVGLIISMIVTRSTTVIIILLVVGVGVSIHILMIKTKKS